MKKHLTAVLSVLLLTACAGESAVSERSTAVPETTGTEDAFSSSDPDSSLTADLTDGYDPFASNGSDDSDVIGSFTYGVEWKDGKELVLDYAPTVSFRYYTENGANAIDFGLLLFVNGFRQPYRTEQEPVDQILHIFDVEQNERKVQTIEFEPIVGEFGETLSVEIISMFHPSFAPTEKTRHSDLIFNHRISSLFPSDLTVTEKTGLKEPAVCGAYSATEISEEMRRKYDKMDSTGGFSGENELENTVFLEILKNDVLLTPADLSELKYDQTPFNQNDSVTVCMYGGGKPCTYRVSLYLDHELVKGAFDGADYIDMTPSRDTICKKVIDPQKLNVTPDAYHHLYLIAIPFYTDKNYMERLALKSTSAVLSFSEQAISSISSQDIAPR